MNKILTIDEQPILVDTVENGKLKKASLQNISIIEEDSGSINSDNKNCTLLLKAGYYTEHQLSKLLKDLIGDGNTKFLAKPLTISVFHSTTDDAFIHVNKIEPTKIEIADVHSADNILKMEVTSLETKRKYYTNHTIRIGSKNSGKTSINICFDQPGDFPNYEIINEPIYKISDLYVY